MISMTLFALAGCGSEERSAESEAANATLLDQETVDALLGADIPQEQFSPVNTGETANASGNEVAQNAADAPANDTD